MLPLTPSPVRRLRHSVARAALALSVLLLSGCAHADTVPDAQMLLGNPDNAAPRASSPQHFLIQRPQYALSYNDTLHFPNWVAWHLTAADVGSTARGVFVPDPTLPQGFTVVTPGDYTHSGYDRGHNCPSADRSDTRQNNDAVFLMTNMTPQAHGLNAGPWEKLESYCRDLAAAGNEMYITCGHSFSAPTHGVIGSDKIAVPDFAWKVVVVLPDRSGEDLSRITARTRVIAVRMPNINTISRQEWTRYIVTPADVEKATGLRFFTALPLSVATALRAERDTGAAVAHRRSRGRRPAADAAPTTAPVDIPVPVVVPPVPTPAAPSPTPAPTGTAAVPAAGQVWVNTKSGAYWKPGTRYYGKTKEGKYMTEDDALKAGYHPAGQ